MLTFTVDLALLTYTHTHSVSLLLSLLSTDIYRGKSIVFAHHLNGGCDGMNSMSKNKWWWQRGYNIVTLIRKIELAFSSLGC